MEANCQIDLCGVDRNMGRKPWASALRLISRNALASGSARLMIDADLCRARGPVCRGQNLIVLSVALCMPLGLIGCGGPKLVEAGGTLKFNNQSIGGADVVFVPDEGGSPVIGRTDEQGRFSLSTDGKLGALPGPYKIAITAVRQKRAVKESEAVGMTDSQIAANHESMIPKKYNNTILSGLTGKVSEDRAANVFSLDLK